MFSLARIALRPALSRGFAAKAKHSLPSLPYAYDALEPFISKEIMILHHTKHHQAYVNGLNAAEEAYAATNSTAEQIKLQSALKFNGGGHINHTLFWGNLTPASGHGGQLVAGSELEKMITRDFGSVENMKTKFNAAAAGIQGSGWGWLGYDPAQKKLEIVTTANQDPLLSHIPIIGIDVWEHAFYLQYKNVKPDYLKAIWNVIDFVQADQRLAGAQKL